jgi:glycosyltransferase involved in cell wall biosynthesis
MGGLDRRVLAQAGLAADVNAAPPKVTVITPTADRLPLLKESVDSVLRQSLRSWELIVVDDASTDGTAEWLAGVSDSRIRVVTLSDRSERCAARNRAMEVARGRYVLHLDDDDRLRPRALERLTRG